MSKPKTSHLKKYRASVRNGSKSSGPLTPLTRAISAKNATTHGLACSLHGVALRSAILANESIDHAQAVLNRYVLAYAPATDLEFELVEDLAILRWRTLRALALETTLFDLATPAARETLAAEFDQADEMLATGAAYRELAAENALSLLSRYDGRIRAQFNRTRKELQALQANRHPQMGVAISDSAPQQIQSLTNENNGNPFDPEAQNATPHVEGEIQ